MVYLGVGLVVHNAVQLDVEGAIGYAMEFRPGWKVILSHCRIILVALVIVIPLLISTWSWSQRDLPSLSHSFWGKVSSSKYDRSLLEWAPGEDDEHAEFEARPVKEWRACLTRCGI